MSNVSRPSKNIPIFSTICWTFFIATSLLILGMAATPGGQSSEESGGVVNALTSIINSVFPELINEGNIGQFHVFVRKAVGHFGLFGFCGSWAYLSFAELGHPKDKTLLFRPLFAGISGLVLAFMSEGIQKIPGLERSGEFQDVFIDMLGFLLGLALAMLIYELISYKRARKIEAAKKR